MPHLVRCGGRSGPYGHWVCVGGRLGAEIGGYMRYVLALRGPAARGLYQYRYVIWTLLAVANSLRRRSHRATFAGPCVDPAPAFCTSLLCVKLDHPHRRQDHFTPPPQALYRPLLMDSPEGAAARWIICACGASFLARGHAPRFMQKMVM